jgi:hypothetical protein
MKTPTNCSPLRLRMIEDMTARNLGPASQRGNIHACKLFASFLGRSPETATPDDVRNFKRYLIDCGKSIHHRNRIMTGVKFLFKVTLRRHDLVAEIYHVREPQKIAEVLAPAEIERILANAPSFKARVMLNIGYGCGLRGGEVSRLRVCEHRQRARHHPCRAEQGKEGSQCDVAGRGIEPAAAVVARTPEQLRHRPRPCRAMDLSRQSSRQTDFAASVPSSITGCDRDRINQEACDVAHTPALVRDPSAGARYRRARHPGAARNNFILPANTGSRARFTIVFTRAAGRW